MYRNLKFLHMADFSPRALPVVPVTNMRYGDGPPPPWGKGASVYTHLHTPPDMHQTMSGRLVVVHWWFIELYSWSKKALVHPSMTTDRGVTRGPLGPKKTPCTKKRKSKPVERDLQQRTAKHHSSLTASKLLLLPDSRVGVWSWQWKN